MKKLIAVLMILAILLIACGDKNTDYSNYNPEQQQKQYVGGGCGVSAPEINDISIINNEMNA